MALTNLVTSLVLDVYDHDTTPASVKAIALDKQTRYIKATLTYRGADYPVDENATVTLTILRPDNVGVQVTGSVVDVDNADRTGTIKGVSAELSQTALAVKGNLKAQFMVSVGDQILRTEIFTVKNGEALDADVSEWAGEYQGYNLDELVQSVNSAVATVGEMESDVSDLKEDLSDLQNEFDNAFIQEVPFELVWSQGNISDSTGKPSGTSVGAIRTDALYDVSEQNKINVVYDNGTYPSSIVFTVYLYDDTQTFLSKVGKYAGTYEIDVSSASYVRFKVARNDSVTEISSSDGNTLVQATKRDVAELASKPYVDGKVNPLIPVVEELSAQKVVKTVSLAWQKGKLSDSGNESQSSSTTFIRNVYAIPITADSVTLTVPSGFKADVHFYSYYATSNSTHYATIEKNLTGTNTITVPTEYRYIRIVLTRSDGADISLSDGNLVILTYIDGDLGSASTSYVNSHPEYISLAMFEKIGVIGDSFASGTIYLNGGNTSEYNLSWPQVIGRKIGAEVANYTEGGLSTKDWLTDANHGLPALLADSAKQLYILALGINDNTQINAGTLALGTLADITSDYTQNPESFYGNYGRIVGNILNHAPKAKIVILSIARPTERQMDTHLLAIAEKLGLPYIQLTDDSYFESGLFYGSMSGNHPLAYGYSGMANAIQRLLETGIANNTAYFADYTG